MNTTEILQGIDEEINRLTEVRSLLIGNNHNVTSIKRGRPAKKKRHLSADARARIAAAQKKRWAKQKREPKQAA